MFRISFVYLYVPYMQNFKKMHSCEVAAGAKLGSNGPFAPTNNKSLFWKFHIYDTIVCNDTPLS